MRLLLMFILLSSCATRFMGDNSSQQEINDENTYEPPEAQPVTPMHWVCCKDLCKGRTPKSVTKELETPYMICECYNGKLFRVTRLRGPNPIFRRKKK